MTTQIVSKAVILSGPQIITLSGQFGTTSIKIAVVARLKFKKEDTFSKNILFPLFLDEKCNPIPEIGDIVEVAIILQSGGPYFHPPLTKEECETIRD